MITESQFIIPCECCAVIRSHERETRCEACGRVLVIEWGEPAKAMTCEEDE